MEHTDKIAIKILKDRYHDYPANDWHYNEQYKMIVEGIEVSLSQLGKVPTLNPKDEYFIFDTINSTYEEINNLEEAKSYIEENFTDVMEGIHPDIESVFVVKKVMSVKFNVESETEDEKSGNIEFIKLL